MLPESVTIKKSSEAITKKHYEDNVGDSYCTSKTKSPWSSTRYRAKQFLTYEGWTLGGCSVPNKRILPAWPSQIL